MRIFYKEVVKGQVQDFLIYDIARIEVHPKFIYYWYADKPFAMFRLNLTDISYVRIYDETKQNCNAG